LQYFKRKYICILNPDTVVAEDTFEIVMAFAKKQEESWNYWRKAIDGSGNFLPESKREFYTMGCIYKITGLV
jgi:GT2 family glycosyltransferase